MINRWYVGMAVSVCTGATACAASTAADRDEAQVSSQPVKSTPAATRGEDYRAPKTMLKYTAAIVEGVVSDITFAFDEVYGPRTVLAIDVDAVHAGAYPNRQLQLMTWGGPNPQGGYHTTSVSTDFVKGARYILVLKNGSWDKFPLMADPLRVEQIDGSEVLINSKGQPLTGMSPSGFKFGPVPVFAEGLPNGTVRTTSVRVNTDDDRTTTEALDRQDFVALLREAMDAEQVKPHGTFNPIPQLEDRSWRRHRATAPGQGPAAPASSQSITTHEEEIQ